MSGASGRLVLELTCLLVAPPEQVFRALTEPAALVQWWGPAGFTTPEVEFDPMVGGAYRLGMQPPDGELFHLAGEFLEVDPPTRLSFSFRWEEPDPDDQETVVTLSLEGGGDRTRLLLRHGAFLTETRLALHKHGWTDSLERLSELLEPDI